MDEAKEYWLNIAVLMDAITSGITCYYGTINDIGDVPERDNVIKALQMLSVLCAKSWGYSEEAILDLWRSSLRDHSQIQCVDLPTDSWRN